MNDESDCPLRVLKAGETGKILALRGGRGFQHRVVSMGLAIGAEVEVIRNHPRAGTPGPVVVRSGDTRLMLGHGMSEKIIVSRIHAGNQPG